VTLFCSVSCARDKRKAASSPDGPAKPTKVPSIKQRSEDEINTNGKIAEGIGEGGTENFIGGLNLGDEQGNVDWATSWSAPQSLPGSAGAKVVSECILAVEFDGAYFHQDSVRDIVKTERLLNQDPGALVGRLRTPGCPDLPDRLLNHPRVIVVNVLGKSPAVDAKAFTDELLRRHNDPTNPMDLPAAMVESMTSFTGTNGAGDDRDFEA